jgi:hypothetical protein
MTLKKIFSVNLIVASVLALGLGACSSKQEVRDDSAAAEQPIEQPTPVATAPVTDLGASSSGRAK